MTFRCYLCGSPQFATIAEREQIRFGCFASDKRVLKCGLCGLVQLYPRWTESELDTLYSTYWQTQDFKGQRGKVKISEYLAEMIRPNDRVLEVGSGMGHNVRFLRQKGFRVTGIDKDPNVCDGRHIIHADVRTVRLKRKPDFIFAIHLLEHLPDPRWFIQWLHDSLAEGGRFALEVPNVDDPLRVLWRNKGFLKFCWYPYHMFYFGTETAKRLFSEFDGLKVRMRIGQEYGAMNHLRWAITGRPGNTLPMVPLLDRIYKRILTDWLKIGDTLIITGEKA